MSRNTKAKQTHPKGQLQAVARLAAAGAPSPVNVNYGRNLCKWPKLVGQLAGLTSYLSPQQVTLRPPPTSGDGSWPAGRAPAV